MALVLDSEKELDSLLPQWNSNPVYGADGVLLNPLTQYFRNAWHALQVWCPVSGGEGAGQKGVDEFLVVI